MAFLSPGAAFKGPVLALPKFRSADHFPVGRGRLFYLTKRVAMSRQLLAKLPSKVVFIARQLILSTKDHSVHVTSVSTLQCPTPPATH
jgi:hypothetical protein